MCTAQEPPCSCRIDHRQDRTCCHRHHQLAFTTFPYTAKIHCVIIKAITLLLKHDLSYFVGPPGPRAASVVYYSSGLVLLAAKRRCADIGLQQVIIHLHAFVSCLSMHSKPSISHPCPGIVCPLPPCFAPSAPCAPAVYDLTTPSCCRCWCLAALAAAVLPQHQSAYTCSCCLCCTQSTAADSLPC